MRNMIAMMKRALLLLWLCLCLCIQLLTLIPCCHSYFLNEPEVRWTFGTGRDVLKGNNVVATRNGQHVFATSADGGLLILSNLEAAAAGRSENDQEEEGQVMAVYEPTLYVFEPPRNSNEATVYCESGAVLVDSNDDVDDDNAQQFAVYGVTEELTGTVRSYVMAVDVTGNLLMTSGVLDGAIRGTPVVLGRYLYVVHNAVNDSFGRVSILNLQDNLSLVETVFAESNTFDEYTAQQQRAPGPFAPAAGREIRSDKHVLVFGESTQQGTSPFGNLYMLVANPVKKSFSLRVVSTMPGATLHAPALSQDATQAFLGSYAAGVNAWISNDSDSNNSRGGGGGGAGAGGDDFSSVLLSSSETTGTANDYYDIFPTWMQRLQGDFFNPNAPIPISPVLSQDASTLFIAGPTNSVFALETQQGQSLWTLETQGTHMATPVVYSSNTSEEWGSEVVYFIERDNGVVRQLDAQQDGDAEVNWEYSDCNDSTSTSNTSCQAVEADFDVADNGNVLYYANVQGQIIAMNVAVFETAVPVAQPPTPEPTRAPTKTTIVEASSLAPTLATATLQTLAPVQASSPVLPVENTTTTTYPVPSDPDSDTGNDHGDTSTTTTDPDNDTAGSTDSSTLDDVGGENGRNTDTNNGNNNAGGSIRGADGTSAAASSETPPSSSLNDSKSLMKDLPVLLGVVAAVLLVSVLLVGLFVVRRRSRNNKQERQAERNSQEITAAAANRWNYNRRVYEEECRLEEAETLSELSKNGSDKGKSSGKSSGKRGGGSGGGGAAASSRKSARANKKKRRKSRRLRRQQQANALGASPAGTALDSISESVDENSIHGSDNDEEESFNNDDDEIMAGSEDEYAGFEIEMEEGGNATTTKPVTKKNLEAAMAACATATTTTTDTDTERQTASLSPTAGGPLPILSNQASPAMAAAAAASICNTSSPAAVPRSPSPFVALAPPTTRASPATVPPRTPSPFVSFPTPTAAASATTAATAASAAATTTPRSASPFVTLASSVKAAVAGTAFGATVTVSNTQQANNSNSIDNDGASTHSFESEEPGRIRVIPRQPRPISPLQRPVSPDPSAFLSVDDSLYIEGESVASGRMCKSVASCKTSKSARTAKSIKSHPDDESNLQRPPTPTNTGVLVGQNVVSPPSMLGPMKNNGGSGNNSDDNIERQRAKRTTATFTNTAAPVARRVPHVVVSRPKAVVPKAVSPESSDSDQPSSSSTEPAIPQESHNFHALGGREAALRGSSVRTPRAGLFTRRARPVEDYRAFASVVDNSDDSEASTHSESSPELIRIVGKVSVPASVSGPRRKERGDAVVATSSKASSLSHDKDAKGKSDIWNSFLTELSKAEAQFFNPDIPKPSSSSSSKRLQSEATSAGQSKRRSETRPESPPPPPPPPISPDDAPDSPPPPPPPLPMHHGEKLHLDTTDEYSDSGSSQQESTVTSRSNSQSSDGGLEL